MNEANAKPRAMRMQEVTENGNTAYSVNGFAANDPVSTINIWKRMEQQGYPTERSIIIMNCRNDRVDRTIQFAVDVLPHLPIDTRSEERRVGKEYRYGREGCDKSRNTEL